MLFGIVRAIMKFHLLHEMIFLIVLGQRLLLSECNVRLLPKDPKVAVNERLLMNCTLYGRHKPYNSSHLTFEIRPLVIGQRQIIVVQDEFVRKANSTTAELQYPDIPAHFNGAYVNCYVKEVISFNETEYVGQQILNVKYRPFVAVIQFDQLQVTNWNYFTYTWKTPNITDPLYTNTIIYYSAWYRKKSSRDCSVREKGSEYEYTNCCNKPHCTACNVSMTKLRWILITLICIKVNATATDSGYTSTTKEFPIDINDYFKPSQIQNLNVNVYLLASEYYQVAVRFNTPNKSRLRYHIQVCCEQEDPQYPTINDTYFNIKKGVRLFIQPDRECSAFLRSITLTDRSRYWSDWTNVTFRSFDSVPLIEVKICDSCFEIEFNHTQNTSKVNVYYKSLSRAEARGTVVDYRATLLLMNSSANASVIYVNASNVYIPLSLTPSLLYTVSISARTSAGYNESLAAKNISIWTESLSSPENFTVIAVLDGQVYTSWFPVPNAESYTVVWCKRNHQSKACDEEIQWREVNNTVLSTVLNFSSHDLILQRSFGVAVKYLNGLSSGISWSKCVYNHSAGFKVPVVLLVHVNSTSICLQIEKPMCDSSFPSSQIYIFAFAFYLTNETDLQDNNGTMLNVDRTALERNGWRFNIDDLLPNTTYNIEVTTFTSAGPSRKHPLPKVTTTLLTESFLSLPSSESEHAGLKSGVIIIGAVAAVSVVAVIILIIIARFRSRAQKWFKLNINVPEFDQHKQNIVALNKEDTAYSHKDSGGYSTNSQTEFIAKTNSNNDEEILVPSAEGCSLLYRSDIEEEDPPYCGDHSFERPSCSFESRPQMEEDFSFESRSQMEEDFSFESRSQMQDWSFQSRKQMPECSFENQSCSSKCTSQMCQIDLPKAFDESSPKKDKNVLPASNSRTPHAIDKTIPLHILPQHSDVVELDLDNSGNLHLNSDDTSEEISELELESGGCGDEDCSVCDDVYAQVVLDYGHDFGDAVSECSMNVIGASCNINNYNSACLSRTLAISHTSSHSSIRGASPKLLPDTTVGIICSVFSDGVL